MNFIEQIKPYLTPALMQKAAAWLGESESGISKALSAIFPTVIGAIASKADNRGFIDSLSGMLAADANLNPDHILEDVSVCFGADNANNTTTSDLGFDLLRSLFGDNRQVLGQAISQHAGIGIGSVGKLLGASAPVVLALLSTQSKSHSDLSSLMAQLASQKAAIISGIPGAIGAAASLSGAGATSAASSFSDNSRRDVKSGGFPLWLIPALVLLGVGIWWFLNAERSQERISVNQPAPPLESPSQQPKFVNAPTAMEPTTVAPNLTEASITPDQGASIERTLPSEVKINIASSGSEAKLLDFIEDRSQVIDKENWVELDRILFDSDTASLRSESSAQIGNVAAILQAFPNVQLKIGGYTDDSGDAASNLKLSAARADSVMNAIVELGIDAARLKAEGYGPEHPEADNATEQGRQKNRRVSARITAK